MVWPVKSVHSKVRCVVKLSVRLQTVFGNMYLKMVLSGMHCVLLFSTDSIALQMRITNKNVKKY